MMKFISSSTRLAVGNIDDEYIRRYVGQLDPFEESCLVQLRQLVAESYKGKVNHQRLLIRFQSMSFSYLMILIYYVFFVLVVLILKKLERMFVIR